MTEFVADLCSNWGGTCFTTWRGRLFHMVQSAARAGFSAVKIQYIEPSKMYASWEKCATLAHLTMPIEFVGELKEYANERGLRFGASVFSVEAVGELADSVDYLKIACAESRWSSLVEAVSKSGVPWHVTHPGAGAWSWSLMAKSLPEVQYHGMPIYPCPIELANVSEVGKIRNYGGRVKRGYSDHTCEVEAVQSAIRHGAQVVELHYAPNATDDMPEYEHTWDDFSFGVLLDCLADEAACQGSKEGVDGALGDYWSTKARDPEKGLRIG